MKEYKCQNLPKNLESDIVEVLGKNNFTFSKRLLRSSLFTNADVAIIIDYDICNSSFPFSYTEYTKEQNLVMHQFKSAYRFIVNNSEDLDIMNVELLKLLDGFFNEDKIKISGVNRELQEVDPTIPEAYFEQAFIDVYGRESLIKVEREFPIIDINGQTRWIDYTIRKKDYKIAIEKNGETYHHPIITGEKQYRKQLIKQNSLVAYGYQVFRWAIEGMRFKDVFGEELKTYLGDKEDFLDSEKLSISRKVILLNHQSTALETINIQRKEGVASFLVVSPTGTGKTEILISDLIFNIKKNVKLRVLLFVPTRQLRTDTIIKFKSRFSEDLGSYDISVGQEISSQVIIQTYSWMSRNYQTFDIDTFDYVAVDEAHHAVAPTLQKAIQHFNPDTLLGLTATDKRLDEKKLEEVFGKYNSDLTLVDAIKQNLLAPIKAFRVKSNIDLSEIRFNGKDYVATDLQRGVIVPSRDQLIVDVLNKYFVGTDVDFKSGLIFCVSISHANSLAKRMRDNGISCKAVSSKEKKSDKYIEQYQNGDIQFLTTCSLLNEGWDSPRTSIIVMARPTMSKVLYTQQIGRGTRKHTGKEALYVIDVVDTYGALGFFKNTPWSIHALLGISEYLQWGDVLSSSKKFSHEELLLAGLYEEERKLEKIDIFTFEEKYADYLSDEQLARELFVSTGTIKSWVKKNKITPDVVIPIGRQKLNYYEPNQITEIRNNLNLKEHNESTQYEDFYDFIGEGNYTFSYKMIMVLSMLKIVDNNGECNLDELTEGYRYFYKQRLDSSLPVDREKSPYSNASYLNDDSKLKNSILANPFEKFERKSFMYHSKDLNHISFSSNLWKRVNSETNRIKKMFFDDLIEYYEQLGGIKNEQEHRDYWGII